ncbi:non-ribosomal peptide synthetase [Chitinophaga pinensis]|uniref:AMP-dependent synthetase and ligase n=1 Tax=Chitinophaga pinensis (strain ATCC 43595 / DSM 2588 / LMG 13176 / NBRC 15968 / NCIMB 11800 / UQM 2034) TaxID=485918 RepID=A0A979G4N6_CHIPD|nr:non-ribosomal peptide synthetase [Chitinophaga pinensis]ACU60867.1 AMP-dependent synthetase and ligase [Chitinophaga pinensis DSM 2588]
MDKRIIHSVFEAKAQLFPERIAVEDQEKKVSYRELNQLANDLATTLRLQGIGRDRIAMTLMGADARLIAAVLAIFKAGGIYLPADFTFPANLMQQVLEEGNPDIVITSVEMLEDAKALLYMNYATLPVMIVMDKEGAFSVTGQRDTLPVPADTEIRPEDGCYIFYTSGSTGKAKAILGNHKGLSHFIHWEMNEFAVNENYRVSQLSQFTFDASLRDIFLPLATGACICIPPAGIKSNIPLLIEWLEEKKINLVHCVPSIFRLITRCLDDTTGKQLFPDLKQVLMAGERLYSKDITQWRNIVGEHVELVNLYGTSETTMAKTFHRIKETPEDPSAVIHVGWPMNNTMVAVLNGNRLCSPGEIGEIYIKTPFMTNGYFRNEALTKSVFVQNPLVKDRVDIMHKTGDMGRFFEDGHIEVHGRLDDQVKINGIRLELGEVKQAVLSAPGVQDAEVIVIPDAFNENQLACYYVGGEAQNENLRTYLQGQLQAAFVPAFFIYMKELPLTINGKVDKKALPRPVIVPAATGDGIEETDPAILTIMSIWREVLGLQEINRNTHFFYSAGTSLKAIMIISKLYRAFNVRLKIRDVFDNATVISLYEHIKSLQCKAFESLELAPVADNYATTYAQKGIWLHLQYGRGLAAYNMTGAYRFEGAFNQDAFIKSLHVLVQRYEMLRTTFVVDKGELRQQIHTFDPAAINISFEKYDNTLDPEGKAVAEADSLKVFDPQKEPLIRFRLLQLNERSHILVLTQHHLVADGWSVNLLLKEFLELFAAFSRNDVPKLPSLKLQYKDYAAWHNAYINSLAAQRHKDFWKAQLEGDLQPLKLSAAGFNSIGKSYEGRLFTFDLPATLSRTVFDLSSSRGKSSFAILLTLTNILLYSYTGREDILLGSPYAGRSHPDLEDQLGLFVSIILLRSQLEAGETFSQLLDEVAANAAEAYEHGIYPFEKILEELELTNNGSGMQFLNVFVQMQEAHEEALETYQEGLQDLHVIPVDFKHQSAKFDLTFNFAATPANGRISVVIEYNTALFTEARIRQVQDDFIRLLEQVAANPETTLAALSNSVPVAINEEISNISLQISNGISRDY